MAEWEQEQDPAETYGGRDTTFTDGKEETTASTDSQLPGTYITSTDTPQTEPEDDD